MTPNRSITFNLHAKGMAKLIRAVTKPTMKTAAEWHEYHLSHYAPSQDVPLKLIEQILLDGWKQGMTDASEFIRSGGYEATAIELRRIRDNKKSL